MEPLQLDASAEPWIDVSVPIRQGMVHWPDNPAIEIDQVQHLERGHEATVSRISLGVHSLTHVDAPVHFTIDGEGVDRVPFDRLIGPARVIDLRELDRIHRPHLESIEFRAGDRILFKTSNSAHWDERAFRADYTCVSLDAAQHLAKCAVATVGIDYLSIGSMQRGVQTHLVLLQADVCIIEGLDLSQVGAGWYDLVCLPLRLEGLDGSPARVVLRRRSAPPERRV
jgi:arylformamidase